MDRHESMRQHHADRVQVLREPPSGYEWSKSRVESDNRERLMRGELQITIRD